MTAPAATRRPGRGAVRRMLAAAVAAALATPLVAVALPSAPAAAAPPAVPCGQVEPAPVLKTDRTLAGKKIKPAPDRRGMYVPIIMVPDWHGRAKHDDTRSGDFSGLVDMGSNGPAPAVPTSSLIGRLQQIPGAAVYTFDYRASAGRWVDDPSIGPALGDAIDCVTSEIGQDAIVVTSGTGGLAARYAVGGVLEGRDRAEKVSTIIGYGSPQTGSQLAELLNTGVGVTASEPRTMLRLLLGACSSLAPGTFGQDAPCRSLPAQAAALTQPGSEAYRGSSAQHLALRAVPTSVAQHAFAGEVRLQARDVGWFGLRPFRTDAVAMGDLVSSTESTTAGAVSQERASCTLDLAAFGSPEQSAGLRLSQAGATGAAPAWAGTARPCFHASLPRVSQFAERAAQIVTAEIRNRQSLSRAELQALPVPSMCGHPAGNLVAGRLPGITPGQGGVALASVLEPDRVDSLTSFGDLTDDGVADTVAVLSCSRAGGLGQPPVAGQPVVAAYDNQSRLLGSIDLSTISKKPVNDVYRVFVSDGQAIMRWQTNRDSDQPGRPTVDVEASFTIRQGGGGLSAGFLNTYNETEVAGKLVQKARDGKRGRGVQALATPAIVDALVSTHQDRGLGDMNCFGPSPTDGGWPAEALSAYGTTWPPVDGQAHGDRFCLIQLGDTAAPALLGMEHRGFQEWQAVEFRLPDEAAAPTDPETVPGEDDELFPFPAAPPSPGATPGPDDGSVEDPRFEDDEGDEDGIGGPFFP